VAPTTAGQRLHARLVPLFTELGAAVAEVEHSSDRPVGLLRINMPRVFALSTLAPLLGLFHRGHPDIVLDIAAEDAVTDIVSRRFDAGIRMGELLEKDMVAVKLGPELEMYAVASPGYLAECGVPKTPRDLHGHRCLNWRWPSDGSLYRWEFVKDGKGFEVSVQGPLTVTDIDLSLRAAIDGVGIAYLYHPRLKRLIEEGKLVRILAAWSPRFPGMYLYYPSRVRVPATLQAFIAFLREAGVASGGRTKRGTRER
jgi:DNA-binding transcriptional LysR family regulator